MGGNQAEKLPACLLLQMDKSHCGRQKIRPIPCITSITTKKNDNLTHVILSL